MTMARVGRLAGYLLAVGLLYAVISFPGRSGEFAELCFRAVSQAAESLGELIAQPLR